MDVTPYCSSAGFDAASPVLSEIHSTLASLDVNVEQVLDIEFFFHLDCNSNFSTLLLPVNK
jgi:hypothetical protein